MRMVTRQLVKAFLDERRVKSKNTHTDERTLYLHGNAIAWRPYSSHNPGAICMTLAGWNSVTTRERLNGLCERLFNQRPFHSKNYAPHFAGVPIDDHDVFVWYPGITDAKQMLTANMMIDDKFDPEAVFGRLAA